MASLGITNAEELPTLKVYTKEFRPLVFKENDKIKGMDIDLLDAVTAEMGMKYELVIKDTFKEARDGVANKEADMAIAGITVTADREAIMDFSYPYIKTGLGILILDKKKSDMIDNAKIIIVSVGKPILYLALFLIGVAHLVWLTEKGSDKINDNYNPGILESAWFVYITITTIGYGDITPKKLLSKFMIVCITLFGFGFFANIVAKMSAESVIKKQAYYIQDENDLRGKKVATEEGTSSIKSISKPLLSNKDPLVVFLPPLAYPIPFCDCHAMIYQLIFVPLLNANEVLGNGNFTAAVPDNDASGESGIATSPKFCAASTS